MNIITTCCRRSIPNNAAIRSSFFHSATATNLARRAIFGNSKAKNWGTYNRLAPASLANIDVRLLPHRPVPDYILRPPYAEEGVSSNWPAEIPLNSPEDIRGMREAGQLAKEILTLGSTICKVLRHTIENTVPRCTYNTTY